MSASPAHGSVAEETARLFEALQDAAATWSRGAEAAPDPEDDGAGETPRACRVCPLCQAIAVVQHVRPETVQHLADAAASLAAAVSDVAAGMARSAGSQPAPRTPARHARTVDVQHIDISD